MGKSIDIRFYEPRDAEQIVELLTKVFPKWNKFTDPLGLWRWKYIDTPARPLISLAVIDDKIIGCNPSLIFNAKIGSEVTTLQYSDDLAVDPNYRGLGLWRKMRELKDEFYPKAAKYIIASTTNPLVLKSWDKRNRSLLPFSVTRMIRTKDIDTQLEENPMKNKLMVKLGYLGLSNLNKVMNLFKTPIERSDDFKIFRTSHFDEDIDSFWVKIKDDYNFILEKKHTYLNWRFTDNDRGKHIKLKAISGDEVLGYVVVGFKEGSSEGQVEDLIALKDRIDVAHALFDSACDCLDDLGINTVYYQVVVGHPYQEISSRKGFIDSRSRPIIEFDYTKSWKGENPKMEIPFLKNTNPSQIQFNYGTTL